MRADDVSVLAISESILGDMVAHCRACAPHEACGILAGVGTEVSLLYTMENAEHSPVGYAMDPREQFRVMKDMRERQLAMVAIFHSHPSSEAMPSAKDVGLAFYDDCLYVIVSLVVEPPAVKAFSIRDGQFREVVVQVSPAAS